MAERTCQKFAITAGKKIALNGSFVIFEIVEYSSIFYIDGNRKIDPKNHWCLQPSNHPRFIGKVGQDHSKAITETTPGWTLA